MGCGLAAYLKQKEARYNTKSIRLYNITGHIITLWRRILCKRYTGNLLTRGTSGLYFQVFEFSKPAKPAFNWSKKKSRAVSTCRIHVTNIKIFKIYQQINLFINISINTTIRVLTIVKPTLIKCSKCYLI